MISWRVGRLRLPVTAGGWTGNLFDLALAYPNILVFYTIRAGLAGMLAFGPAAWGAAWPLTLLLYLGGLLIEFRCRYGHDGADQMSSIMMLVITLAHVAGTDLAIKAALGFLAFQVMLSYATAGWAKAPMAGWRDGTYIAAILSTRIYGTPAVGKFLTERPRLAKLATWTVLTWECTFPVVLIAPPQIAYGYLGLGILFHVSNAVLMGLNSFVWAFIATYPAVVWWVLNRGF